MNLTVKPSAYMTLFKDGVDISGGNVKLTDVITMEIQLDPKFKGTFFIDHSIQIDRVLGNFGVGILSGFFSKE